MASGPPQLQRQPKICARSRPVAADSLPDGAEATHINLYDNTVEGIRLKGRPVFGIQYHPEASPGPHDAAYLFRRFTAAMRNARR